MQRVSHFHLVAYFPQYGYARIVAVPQTELSLCYMIETFQRAVCCFDCMREEADDFLIIFSALYLHAGIV